MEATVDIPNDRIVYKVAGSIFVVPTDELRELGGEEYDEVNEKFFNR